MNAVLSHDERALAPATAAQIERIKDCLYYALSRARQGREAMERAERDPIRGPMHDDVIEGQIARDGGRSTARGHIAHLEALHEPLDPVLEEMARYEELL